MDCFIDHIGIKACGATPATGDIYINELPGVTFKMIEGISDAEHESFVVFWNEIQQRALRRFRKDYLRKFNNKYQGFCCTIEDCNPELIACNNIPLFEDAWMNLLGVELMTERLYSARLNRYTTMDKAQAAELKDFFMVEYEKSINSGLCMIPKEILDKCFVRTSMVDSVERLP
jgi:hypothetical protein